VASFRFNWKKLWVKPNRRLTVFLVCVGVSAIFWLLNALTKSYVISVSVPIEYTEIPTGSVIVNQPPDHIQVRMEGDGFNLLPMNSERNFKPVRIDLSEFAFTSDGKRERTQITTRSIQRELSDQVGSLVNILGTSLDSIAVVLEKLDSKMVPVRWGGEVQVADNHRLQAVRFAPDSVRLTGPGTRLSQFSEITTVPGTWSDLSRTITETVPLNLTDSLVQVVPSDVEVSLAVEQVTQGSVDVRIASANVPDSLSARFYPSKVKVNFRIGFSAYESIRPQDFRATVDFVQLFPDRPPKVRVKVEALRNDLEIMNYTPERVEYILRKR